MGRREAEPPIGGIYRRRNPRASPLYQCVRRRGDELNVSGLISRSIETQVLECFPDTAVRLQLFALAYTLGNFFRRSVLPRSLEH